MNVLDALQAADRDALVERWQAAFKCEPPARTNTGLMRRVLAWQVQCEASGFKPPAASSKGAASSRQAIILRPGMRLLREWRDATHEVRVMAQGFEYNGKTYASLSRIARTITGTPWSGPAFFGVKG